MITLHYSTIENNKSGKDIPKFVFANAKEVVDFLNEKYQQRLKEDCVFVCMVGSESHEYYVGASDENAIFYIGEKLAYEEKGAHCFFFEEPTFEEAFMYCKDASESHELGLKQ